MRYNISGDKTAMRQNDYRVLAEFRYEIRRFMNFSERAARKAGIEPHQHQALLVLKGLPAFQIATVGVLAERLQIQHHSAVALADRLESKGLIRRSRGQEDRREILLGLTLRGEKLLRELTLSHRTELRMVGPKLVESLESVIARRRRGRASHTCPLTSDASRRIRRNRKTNK
jgi:DNA-binding MarR family transcriptional regulator